MCKLSIQHEVSADVSRALFANIAKDILPLDYELNLVFVGPKRIQELNLIYRGKDTPTDILSFPLEKNKGEIYICPSESRIEAKKFDRSLDNFLAFLFIHGCVHLKGYDHSAKMESIEAEIRKRYNI